MDWIKVYIKHYYYTNLSLSEMGMLISIQLLTAKLEEIPTEDRMLKLPEIGRRRLDKLKTKLDKDGTSLHQILTKVLEDANKVQQAREHGKNKMVSWRGKKKDVTSNVTSIDKIREDNIREEEIVGISPFLVNVLKAQNRDYFKIYPKQLPKCCFHMKSAIASGWSTDEVHQRLLELSGKLNDTKPWEIFPKKEQRSAMTAEETKAYLKQTGGV